MVPLALYKQEYDKRIKDIDEKEAGLATFLPYISDASPEAKGMYDSLNQKIDYNASIIGTPGYLLNEAPVRNLKKEYARTTSELTGAAKNYEAYRAHVQSEADKHPGLVYNSLTPEGDIKDTPSIDDFLHNKNMKLVSVDTDTIASSAAAFAKSISSRLSSSFANAYVDKSSDPDYNGRVIKVQGEEGGAPVEVRLEWFLHPDEYKQQIENFKKTHKGEAYQRLFDANVMETRDNILKATDYSRLSEENRAKVDAAYARGFDSGLGPYQIKLDKNIGGTPGGSGGGRGSGQPKVDVNQKPVDVIEGLTIENPTPKWTDEEFVVTGDGGVATAEDVQSDSVPEDIVRKYRNNPSLGDAVLNDNDQCYEAATKLTELTNGEYETSYLNTDIVKALKRKIEEVPKPVLVGPDHNHDGARMLEFRAARAEKVREFFADKTIPEPEKEELWSALMAAHEGKLESYIKSKDTVREAEYRSSYMPNIMQDGNGNWIEVPVTASEADKKIARIKVRQAEDKANRLHTDGLLTIDSSVASSGENELAKSIAHVLSSEAFMDALKANEHLTGNVKRLGDDGKSKTASLGIFNYKTDKALNESDAKKIKGAIESGKARIRLSEVRGLVAYVPEGVEGVDSGNYTISIGNTSLNNAVLKSYPVIARTLNDFTSDEWHKNRADITSADFSEFQRLKEEQGALYEAYKVSYAAALQNPDNVEAKKNFELVEKTLKNNASEVNKYVKQFKVSKIKESNGLSCARLKIKDGNDLVVVLFDKDGGILGVNTLLQKMTNGSAASKYWTEFGQSYFNMALIRKNPSLFKKESNVPDYD